MTGVQTCALPILNAHYRTGLNFAFSALDDARKSLARIDACVEAVAKIAGADAPAAKPDFAKKALEDFTAAVNDDLNLPKAFAATFELVRHANAAVGAGTLTPESAAGVLAAFKRMDEVLGVIFFENEKKEVAIPDDVKAILEQRAAARAAKNWAESDRLRDALAAQGWLVKDSKAGQSVTHA